MLLRKLDWRDALVLFGAFLFSAVYCFVFSRHRILWSDELFSWMLVTDPTWHHMVEAWRQGGDGGGILFYVLCRLWLTLLGHSTLAYRAFSAAGCLAAFVAIYVALRRLYALPISASMLALVWLGSRTLLWQMIQTRFYGLTLAAAALTLFAAVDSAQQADSRSLSARPPILPFLANLLLVGSHPFGLLYSSAILIASLLADLLQRRRRPGFYLASIASWTILLFSLEAIRNSARVGQPHFWTTRPTLQDLHLMFTSSAGPHGTAKLLLVILLGLAVLALGFRFSAATRRRSVLLFPALALVTFPLFIWLASQHGTSYFVDRYVFEFTLGVAVLGCEILTLVFAAIPSSLSPATKPVAILALLFLLFRTGRDAFRDFPREVEVPTFDYTPALAASLPTNIPIVFERADLFDVMLFYQHPPSREFVYLLDWPVALAPDAPRGLVSGYHEMENWKRLGYNASAIVPWDDFLAHRSEFLFLQDPDMHWLDHRIFSNPAWSARPVGSFFYRKDLRTTFWLVQRRSQNPS